MSLAPPHHALAIRYIDQHDIAVAAARARGGGHRVVKVEVDTPHIQTIFRKPATLFDTLAAAAAGAGGGGDSGGGAGVTELAEAAAVVP
jgi:hypothetical protein